MIELALIIVFTVMAFFVAVVFTAKGAKQEAAFSEEVRQIREKERERRESKRQLDRELQVALDQFNANIVALRDAQAK